MLLQLILHCFGLIISKISYCISCYANCPGYFKKRLHKVISEAANIVQFVDLNWLTLEGWINYLDVFEGKSIGDYQNPLDLAAKVYQRQQDTAGDQLWNYRYQRITRALLAGKVRLDGENIGQFTARKKFFIPRYVRALNYLPTLSR